MFCTENLSPGNVVHANLTTKFPRSQPDRMSVGNPETNLEPESPLSLFSDGKLHFMKIWGFKLMKHSDICWFTQPTAAPPD